LTALGVDRPLRVGVVDLAGELPPQPGRLAEHVVHVYLEQALLRARGIRVDVLALQLPHIGQAEERVAVQDLVIDEGERELRVQRHQPQRQLAHLHGHRVDVRAVQAGGDNRADRVGLQFGRRQAGDGLFPVPGLDEPVG